MDRICSVCHGPIALAHCERPNCSWCMACYKAKHQDSGKGKTK